MKKLGYIYICDFFDEKMLIGVFSVVVCMWFIIVFFLENLVIMGLVKIKIVY